MLSWCLSGFAQIFSCFPSVSDDVIYFGSDDGNLYAVH